MIKIKLCLVLILLTDVVEANVTYNVKCSGEGDVYIRPKSQVSNLASERFEFMFASSKDNVCNQQVTGDVVKIYGCLQADVYPFLEVFLRDGANTLFILKITCLPDKDPLQPDTRRIIDLNRDRNEDHSNQVYSTGRRNRRQEVPSDTKPGNDVDDEIKTFQTSVSFSVKLNYSSNDEISIVCSPDDQGILYVSNPDPAQLTHVSSFSELTGRKCHSEFIEGRHFVAIGGCNLNYPITVSFNNIALSSVIGGSKFKVYNVSCTEQASIERGNVFPDSTGVDTGSSGVGGTTSSLFVVREILVFLLTYIYLGIYF